MSTLSRSRDISVTIGFNKWAHDLNEYKPAPVCETPIPLNMIPNTEMTLEMYFKTRVIRNKGKFNRFSKSDINLMENLILPMLNGVTLDSLFMIRHKFHGIFAKIERSNGSYIAFRSYRIMYNLSECLLEDGMLPVNIISKTYEPVRKGLNKTLFSAVEIRSLKETCFAHTDLLPVLFLFYTMISIKEFCRLRVRDYTGYSVIISDNTKGRFAREVPLMSESAGIIEILGDLHNDRTDMDSPLFINKRGRAFSESGIRRLFGIAADLTKNNKIRYENFMSDFLIRSIRANMDPIAVKEYLGLSVPDPIMRYWESIPRISCEN